MRTLLRAFACFISIYAFHNDTFAQQVAKTIASASSPIGRIGFLEFRPSDYGSQKHPLMIFLHGIGERGNGIGQISSVAQNGPPNLCANGATMRFTVNGQTSSFVILSPQLAVQYGYWPTYYVKEMIAYAKANLSIDPNRIYVTGLSLGGGGVWRLITDTENFDHTFDGTIAAAAPVCGTQEENDYDFCSTIGANHLPIWAFHSMDDGTVNVGATQHAEILSNMCGITPAPKFTYYQSGGHAGAWLNAYDTGHIARTLSNGTSFTPTLNLYEWLLTNTRGTTTQPVYTAPTVSAGIAQTITLPISTITLTGTASGTGGATISSYSWTKTSGPDGGVLSLPLLNTTLVTGLVQGTYVFTLTATDNHGLSSSSSITVTVNPLLASRPAATPNQIPVAVASASASTITLPNSSITLDASGSYDTDGSIASYWWTQTAGPSGAQISTRDGATTTVTGLTAGNYTFVLQVNDNSGAAAYGSVSFTVNNAPVLSNQNPVAVIYASATTITLPTNTIAVDGSASYDTDGSIASYRWTQTDGPSGSQMSNRDAAKTTITGLTAGNYTFVLQVTDNAGAVTYAGLNVTVASAPATTQTNQYPVAVAGSDISVTLPNSTATLNAAGSYDPDGYIAGYWWTQISGPAAVMGSRDAAVNTITGLTQGDYTFVLQVKDNGGLLSYSSVKISVGAAPPSTGGQPIGYLKQSTGYYQACGDASTSGRIPIYSSGLANGNIVYLDAALTKVFDGGFNWFSYTQTLGGVASYALSVFPDGSIHLLAACSSSSTPPATTPVTSSNLLGYVKISTGPYQACDDASSSGRMAVYGKTIANGSYLYLDAAMTQLFDGGWNWYSFTPTLGGKVTAAFAVYPIGTMGLQYNCASGSRTASGSLANTEVTAAITATGKLNIYPNPVRTSATIELSSLSDGAKTINIYNANGTLAAKYNWQTVKGTNTFPLRNISGLPGGLYIADIRDSNGNPVGKVKFVKQ